MDGLPIWQHQSDSNMKLSVLEQTTQDVTDIPCQLEKEEDKYFITFQVDYEGLSAPDPSLNRCWDVFVHLCIDGVYQSFQLALTSAQVGVVARDQVDDDAWHQIRIERVSQKQ